MFWLALRYIADAFCGRLIYGTMHAIVLQRQVAFNAADVT